MLKTTFKTKPEMDIYIQEQKVRQYKGYLTCSERRLLQEMIDNPNKYIIEEKLNPHIKKIITDISILRKSCQLVTKEDNIDEIINSLKETLKSIGGLGLSTNQIGYNKQISYCKIPKLNSKTKQLEYNEIILINPKIIEKERKIIFKNEGCLSIPYIRVDTDRYVFITVKNHDKNLKEQIFMAQDLESFVIQHELDHLNGITILERKHRKKR